MEILSSRRPKATAPTTKGVFSTDSRIFESFCVLRPSERTDWAIPWEPAAPRLWFADRDRLRLVAHESGKLKLLREIPLQDAWCSAEDPLAPGIHVTRHGAVLVRTT